ncbi:2-hydroxyacid dehydrogenase [Alphaproteobacteria bacterium]|nr:2-hydroxyacid dehydrogenase [Alphaproteobacteria bacterium]
MTKTILSIDKLISQQMPILQEHFEVIRLWREDDPEKVIQERAHDIAGVVSSLLPVSNTLIEALPNLEIIANCAVGYNNIDIDFCRKRGIAVTNTPNVLNNDTADVALLLMLNVMRRSVEGDAYLRAGLWQSSGPLGLGSCLADKTVGIVGLGRIGKAIAGRVEAFGMTVIYNGRNKQPDQPYEYFDNLENMAKACDVLVAICPGTAETEGLINHKILKALGENGFFINAARGSVVVQEDLIIALHNKEIAGAGLDVYWNEPNVPNELISMDNVVLTPHIGSATIETRAKMTEIVLGNLLAHFDGRALLTPV